MAPRATPSAFFFISYLFVISPVFLDLLVFQVYGFRACWVGVFLGLFWVFFGVLFFFFFLVFWEVFFPVFWVFDGGVFCILGFLWAWVL